MPQIVPPRDTQISARVLQDRAESAAVLPRAYDTDVVLTPAELRLGVRGATAS